MSLTRIETIQQALREQQVAAAFIQGKENVFYLTGFRTDPHERIVALIILPDEAPFLIVPGMEKSLVKKPDGLERFLHIATPIILGTF